MLSDEELENKRKQEKKFRNRRSHYRQTSNFLRDSGAFKNWFKPTIRIPIVKTENKNCESSI